MTVENMKGFLIARYPGSKDWAKKVAKMHDNQVIAIYYRMLRAGDFEQKEARKKKQQARYEPGDATILYVCNGCNSIYVRDNPELEECEFCGSTDLEPKVFRNQQTITMKGLDAL